ncbi:MAG TPA: hypothetical protein PLW88_06980, partial [Syntrophorhabdaceae bacterium]|nr:hypothetical protein [Syntrophorhabdaceae bacterium]
MLTNEDIAKAMTIRLDNIVKELPSPPSFKKGIRRAPKRAFTLNKEETILALKNALRYIPEKWHKRLAPEFLNELKTMGRIYGYRFRPHGRIKGEAIDK